MDVSPLLVDQRSVSLAPADEEIRVWAAGRRVFVSSLITDMPQERAAVRTAIESIGATPVMFEDLGAQDVSAEQAYLSGVRSSDIYIGLWGTRYGVRMPSGYSATHAEYREAEQEGLRLCLYVHGEASGQMDGAQRDLVEGARNLYTTSPWSDPSDLGSRVQRRLKELAAEELAPWVRVGRTLFRAREIVNDGQTIAIMASVRSDAVHSELVRLRDTRAGDVPFASPHAALRVQVTELSTKTVSTAGHDERLKMSALERRTSGTYVAMSGVSTEEAVMQSLSDGLFGTTLLGEQARWITRPVDPLAPLKGMGLDDGVLRAAARLLLTEWLLGEGFASRVDSLALGPAHQGARRLRIQWVPRSTYTGQPDPVPMVLDGTVAGL